MKNIFLAAERAFRYTPRAIAHAHATAGCRCNPWPNVCVSICSSPNSKLLTPNFQLCTSYFKTLNPEL